WFCAVDAGQTETPEQFCSRHCDLQPDLGMLLAAHTRFESLTDPLRALAQDLAAPTDRPNEPLGTGLRLDNFELLELVGQGGMGLVYKARQKSPSRLVALKMIRAGALATSAEVQRFHNEAEAAAALDHPHIVPIYEVGAWQMGDATPPIPYFTMKLMDGGSL